MKNGARGERRKEGGRARSRRDGVRNGVGGGGNEVRGYTHLRGVVQVHKLLKEE